MNDEFMRELLRSQDEKFHALMEELKAKNEASEARQKEALAELRGEVKSLDAKVDGIRDNISYLGVVFTAVQVVIAIILYMLR